MLMSIRQLFNEYKSGRDFVRAAERSPNVVYIRQGKGDHVIVRAKNGEQRSVPMHRELATGTRIVALGKDTLSMMCEHYDRQLLERQFAGWKWQERGPIFTTGIGTPVHPRNLHRGYKDLRKAAGLPDIRFHDLRHTAISLMLNNDVPVIIVSRRVGHARPSITLDRYGHLMPNMQQEAAELIDSLASPVIVDL